MRAGSPLHIGCAGWALPAAARDAFPQEGSHLARYAAVFTAAEINSSFYRPHRPATYARWAASVPDEFRFSVKVPKSITHAARLERAQSLLDAFLPGPFELGEHLGSLLVQLPPSLVFDAPTVRIFCRALRSRVDTAVVFEPRHVSWFTAAADDLLGQFRIGRAGADPPPAPGAGLPGAWPETAYFRLHGSPRMYYSSYPAEYLDTLARRLAAFRADGAAVWCIFDNTAHGAATADALALRSLLPDAVVFQ